MPTEERRTKNLYTGKGGEVAVMSELLFRSFNASILPVDAGIDIAAIKGSKTHLIQVKTRHWNRRGWFPVTLELDALKRFIKSNVFVVLVGRSRETEVNDFIILPIKILEQVAKKLREVENQRGKKSIKFLFRKLKNGEISLNQYGRVSEYKNAWDKIR